MTSAFAGNPPFVSKSYEVQQITAVTPTFPYFPNCPDLAGTLKQLAY